MAKTNWRAADLRGDTHRPSSVRSVVQRVHVGLLAVRAAESLLFGCAAAMGTLAAAVASGANQGRLDTWCVALLAGSLAGLSWWRVHAPCAARPQVARELDRRLRHQGALLTAFECEERAVESPLARLLRRRVLDRLRSREALRSLLPALAPPVLAPLLGAFLLAAAIERSRPPQTERPPDPAALAAGLLQELDGARGAAVEQGAGAAVDAATVRALLELEKDVRTLVQELGESPADARDARDARDRALETLRELEDEIARHEAQLADQPEVRRRLSAARAWLDGTRQALRGEPPEEGGPEAPVPGPRSAAGSSAVASPDPDGTIPPSFPRERPDVDAGAQLSEDSDAPGRPESPSAAVGNWWPREHDPVVERWIESRRRAARPRRESGG